MTERERLIDVLNKAYGGCARWFIAKLADAVIADGWVRPPCKVGDTVYFVARNSGKPIGNIDELEIVIVGKTESGFCAKGKMGENTFDIIPHFEIDNYSFFATREEAEKALKGGGSE